MSRYRKVDSMFWNDAEIRSFNEREQLITLFVMTHPNLTSLGAMRATIAGLASEMNIPEKAFRKAFQKPCKKVICMDEKSCFIWLPNFLKYNKPESPNVVKSWHNALVLLPECNMKNKLIQYVKDYLKGFGEGFQKALPEDFRKGMPYQEQEQEPEQEQEKYIKPEEQKIKYGDYVEMKEAEYLKLVSRFGEPAVKGKIEEMDNYVIGQSLQKKYTDHYRTILEWLKKDKPKPATESMSEKHAGALAFASKVVE